jgi:hypothetical protein
MKLLQLGASHRRSFGATYSPQVSAFAIPVHSAVPQHR